MTELEFTTELEHVAQAELDAWRNYTAKRAELEAAKSEAAEALLDADTPAARKRFNEATQGLALLEASLIAARNRRERLFATYCHGRVADLRTRALELKEQAKFIDTERRKFLGEIAKLEGVKIFDPPLAEYDAMRKSDQFRAEAEDLLAAAAHLELAGIPRAGVACGTTLDELLADMLSSHSIPPTCEAVAQWFHALAGALPGGRTIKFARIAWHHSRLMRDASFIETDRNYWLYFRDDGTIGEQQATRPLAELPPRAGCSLTRGTSQHSASRGEGDA
jgi:hypothetical protein